MRYHHVAFVELRPGLEAPLRHARGITSLYWGTTRDSSYEGPWDYVHLRRRHQDSLTTRVMELRPTHTLFMLHPTSQVQQLDQISKPPNSNHSTKHPNLLAISLKITDLTQARRTLSLRRNPSRLGESAIRKTVGSAMSRLGESHLA